MNVLDDTMLIFRIAKSYYLEGLSQSEIAKQTGISRPQVSRIIKKSLELGIVKIEVSLPETIQLRKIKNELASFLELPSLYIIPSTTTSNDNFFSLASEYVCNSFEHCKNIGIGWGRSVYETSFYLPLQRKSNDMILYPLIGSSGNNNPYLQSGNIIDRFAEKLHAKPYYFNMSVFTKLDEYSSSLQKSHKYLSEKWKTLDAAVIGLGGYELIENFYIKEITENPFFNENKKTIAGDILATFVTKNHSLLNLPDYVHAACPLDILKNIPKTIAIAKGASKVDIIYFAAKNKYINTLITDDTTAKLLLKNAR